MTPDFLTTRRDLLTLLPGDLVIAEIGVFAGEFSREILEVCNPATLHLVDLWSGITGSGDVNGHRYVSLDLTNYDQLLARSLPPCVQVHKSHSISWLLDLKPGSLDAIYLDGDHSGTTVAAELDLARSRVRKGGWIMGHDYACLDGTWDFSSVALAVDSFVRKEGLVLNHLTSQDNCQSYAILNS